MKHFAILFCASVLLVGRPAVAHADAAGPDDASKMAKIEQMMVLTHADRIVNQTLAQIQPMMANQLKQLDVPDDARSAIDDMQKKITDVLTARLSWEKLKPVYVKIYADTFTEDELNGVIEFYTSAAGQALLEKMPSLIQKTMALTQELMSDVLPEISKMGDELGKKYKKQ